MEPQLVKPVWEALVWESTAFAALSIAFATLGARTRRTGYKQARGRFVAMPTPPSSLPRRRKAAPRLCKKLSSTVAGTLGKPESYVMVTFQKATRCVALCGINQ